MGFSRSGMPAHLEPWHSEWAASGNGFGVNFIPDYKILHDAGYHVLAYDLRNHGLSGAANGGITTSGIFEARDVAGSLSYARSRPDTREAAVGLFSRCMGASSSHAHSARPISSVISLALSAARAPSMSLTDTGSVSPVGQTERYARAAAGPSSREGASKARRASGKPVQTEHLHPLR